MKLRFFWASAMLAISLFAGTARAQTAPGNADISPPEIDHLLRAAWKQQGIVPAPPADDARFLRRLSLDILGTIPTSEAVTAFVRDTSPDKRNRMVAALLDDPRYADHWADYWDNTLMGRTTRAAVVDRRAFHDWLRAEFARSVPWNKFVYDLITASGVNSAGGSYAQAYGGAKSGAMEAVDTTAATGGATPINGATNWILKYRGKPEDLSGTSSKIFLGVQIQCAQCHDHKTEKWKQDDFRRFTACFVNVRPRQIDGGMKTKGMVQRLDTEDVARPFVPRNAKIVGNTLDYVNSSPTAIDGTSFADSPNRRIALAAWMTAPANPWFADAYVNRMWSHFFGRGFVEPIDDFRPSNPVVLPELMKRLSADFVANGYDTKRLIRLICATQAYQLSSAKAVKDDPENHYWARYRLKSLTPEETLDALIVATNMRPVLQKVTGDNIDALRNGLTKQFAFVFDVDEEFEEKEFEGSIPQALMLLNGNLVNRGVTPIPGTALAEVLAMPGDDAAKIESLYLRTLSRKPTQGELTKWETFVSGRTEAVADTNLPTPNTPDRQPRRMVMGGKRNNGLDPLARIAGRISSAGSQTPKQQAYEDLFWALLNSSEFMFNH